MDNRTDLREISAEMLLGYLYPELEDKWVARHEGTFYRNYNDDALSVDPERAEIILARDGFLKLLPEGLINTEDELKGKETKARYEAMQKRLHLLNEAFLPLDSMNFRKKLKIERKVSELLDDKFDFVLRYFFGIEVTEDTDSLVREAVYQLPSVSRRRGDMPFVRELLRSLTGYPVVMTRGRYSGTDNTKAWLPLVRYDILIPDLDSDGYRQKVEEFRPLFNFLLEWFVPVDVMCKFGIRQKAGSFGTDKGIILDYNVEIE